VHLRNQLQTQYLQALTPMEFYDIAGMTARARALLEQAVAPLRSLEDLLGWSRQHQPPLPSPTVVTQDEYTHDVLIAYPGGRWLDFDTT
jgi:hypothetical protein